MLPLVQLESFLSVLLLLRNDEGLDIVSLLYPLLPLTLPLFRLLSCHLFVSVLRDYQICAPEVIFSVLSALFGFPQLTFFHFFLQLCSLRFLYADIKSHFSELVRGVNVLSSTHIL